MDIVKGIDIGVLTWAISITEESHKQRGEPCERLFRCQNSKSEVPSRVKKFFSSLTVAGYILKFFLLAQRVGASIIILLANENLFPWGHTRK
jgi:hypothetical protein